MGSQQNNKGTAKRKRKKSSGRGDWGGFIECALGKSERTEFKEHLSSNKVSIWDSIQELVEQEVNISVSWSDKEESFLAKATMVNEEDGKRYMLSAFHSDLETAIELLLFKHFKLLGGDWFDSQLNGDEDDHWG